MPSSSSQLNNYYASHHRRGSQLSLAAEQSDAQRPLQSPNRSLVFLPSSTYTPQDKSGTRDLLVATSTSAHNASLHNAQFDRSTLPRDHSPDSRTFYSQHRQHQFLERPTSPENGDKVCESRSNGHGLSQRRGSSFEASKSTSALSSTLRQRNSSIKELVAKYEATPGDDIPTVLSRPGSRVASRAASPTIGNPIMSNATRRPSRLSSPEARSGDYTSLESRRPVGQSFGNQIPGPQHPGRRSVDPLVNRSGHAYPTVNTQSPLPNRQPLFGEVLSQTSALGSPGYGIRIAKRRRGSEGSPMHSPNPMFPTTMASAGSESSPISPTAWYRDAAPGVGGANGLHSSAITSHRRTKSDLSDIALNRQPLQRSAYQPSQLALATFEPATTATPPSHARVGSHSRIPISRRQNSLNSDSGRSSPISRAHSTMDKYPINSIIASDLPKEIPPTTPKRSSPKRKPHSPIGIQSPGRRGPGAIPQSQKSPSLRANIIAPPAKISPPLRSSRPRQPVSSASTAASRAKMAEKFETAQRKQTERGSASRNKQKPKELDNVDFEARRQNITQKLDKLRHSQASMRSTSSLREAQNRTTFERMPISPANEDDTSLDLHTTTVVPIVVVNTQGTQDDGDQDEFQTPEETFSPAHDFPSPIFVHSSQSEVQGLRIDVTSPVNRELNGSAYSTSRLQTSYRPREDDPEPEAEPDSAITVGTEATLIDTEPQAPFTRPKSPRTRPLDQSLLSQVMGMRQRSPYTPTTASCSESGDNVSDHADEESVQIMLRNTRYLDEVPSPYPSFHQESQSSFPEIPEAQNISRNSWTSSIANDTSDEDRLEVIAEASPDPHRVGTDTASKSPPDSRASPVAHRRRDIEPLDSIRNTMASDAYTIVDFVLQQRSSTGFVERDVVDNMVQRVLDRSPQQLYQETFDMDRVERLTLEELEREDLNEENLSSSVHAGETAEARFNAGILAGLHPFRDADLSDNDEQIAAFNDMVTPRASQEVSTEWLPEPAAYQYRPSRAIDNDWVTSHPAANVPSYADMEVPPSRLLSSEALSRVQTEPSSSQPTGARYGEYNEPLENLGLSMRVTSPVSTPWEAAKIPRAPTHSPPPTPTSAAKSVEAIVSRFSRSSSPTSPVFRTAKVVPPQIPRRITSQSQISASQHSARSASIHTANNSAIGPDSSQSMDQQNVKAINDEEKLKTDQQRKLKQRTHVIRELIDTELTFERDMKVVVDIYQATAEPIVSKADTQIIFGNSEHVVQFSRNFGSELKRTAKAVYAKPPPDPPSAQGSLAETSSFASVPDAESGNSANDTDLTDAERDRTTRIGEVFLTFSSEMEDIYREYLVKHDAANKKVQIVLQTAAGKEWTRLCHAESRDLTSAWDLDSLLVKPVQRLLKYPLFLKDLLKSTPEDHPDLGALQQADKVVTDAITRINEAKKHHEHLEQVLQRKRKDSNTPNGFIKGFSRRGEKLKQNMGLSEVFEDEEYNRIHREFEEHVGLMAMVLDDQSRYPEMMIRWSDHLCRLGEVADSLVEILPSRYVEMESKLRHFSQEARRIRRTGLAPHLAEIDKVVFEPVRNAHKMVIEFKENPKNLLQKREKRAVDYARFKNMKDREQKLDKKIVERMEQWEALNREAKSRMLKLVQLTRTITCISYSRFFSIHGVWTKLCMENVAQNMSIDTSDLSPSAIERDFQSEFDPVEAVILSLSIANRTLLAEIENMMKFHTPSSTFRGDESPRQQSYGSKRSISVNSDGSHSAWMDYSKRNSGNYSASPMIDGSSNHGVTGFENSRLRASSAAAGSGPRTPDFSSRNATFPMHAPPSPQPRPGTSPGTMSDHLPAFAPRVSIDAPSPYIGSLRPESPGVRPETSSTVPTSEGTQHAPPTPAGGAGSSIFSSAMPMSDSPVSTRGPSFEQPHPHPPTRLRGDLDAPVLFTAASVYEFNIDQSRQEAGWPYLTYVAGEIFDVIGEKGELWLSRNQDDQSKKVGWIWNKHFAKLAD